MTCNFSASGRAESQQGYSPGRSESASGGLGKCHQMVLRPVGPKRRPPLTRCRPYRPGNDLRASTQASARRLASAWAITWRAFSPSRWPQFSIPRVPFIQWFAIFLTEAPVFGFEIFLCVMLRLAADVFAHRVNVHGTYAKFPVATLP